MSDPLRYPRTMLVSSRSIVAMAQAARAVGIQVDLTVLAPHHDLENTSGAVPLDQQIAVCRAILSDPRETLGLELAMHLPLASTGLWGFLLCSSSTFGEMLSRARRYQRIVNVYEEFTLEELGENLAMICHHPDPSPFGPREHVVIWLLCHWLTWGRQLSGHPMPVISANFQWSGPRNAEPFERFFGGDAVFGQTRDALIFPKTYLELPFRDSTPELGAVFEAYAAAAVSKLSASDDVLHQVETAILEGLLTGKSAESDIAARLGVTSRTLHRRLAAAGTHFRRLRDAVVLRRAKTLLSGTVVPFAEISFLLGFSEPSSFHRAFRRWTGKTPAEWRRSR